MRGVHPSFLFVVGGCAGSSPHARGPQVEILVFVEDMGIIPACAGSTASTGQRWRLMKDHPRMRGVHDGKPTNY